MKMRGISLRYKFMAALLVIPLIGLSLFLLIAKNIFEMDKIAYVFDSSLQVTKTRAARVNSEITSVISLSQAIVLSYRSDTRNLADTGVYFFDRETKLDAFRIMAWNPATSSYEKTVDLVKPSGKTALKDADAGVTDLALETSKTRPIVVMGIPGSMDRLLLAVRFGEVTDPNHVTALVVFDASELMQIFADKGPYHSYLARKDNGRLVFQPVGTDIGWSRIWEHFAQKKVPEGIEEIPSPLKAGVRYLASYSEVGVAGLMVTSFVDKKAALAAVDVLLRQSLMFFLIVISATMIVAVIASRGMTYALSNLSDATLKVAQGDFDVRVNDRAGGEIGLLATSFNAMAGEVSRLMKETAEKARMESELATARAVQETLFPEPNASIGTVEISGHYQPASECGGDWWFYCENGDKVYIWIGDATGHGAPAALLTSAARAVASVITQGPPLPVSDCLAILNHAICDTSKGQMMMTFFIGCIDKVTGEFSYANASHEPPYLLNRPEAGVEPKRDSFIPLNAVNNPRLGERMDCSFRETSIQLKPGDTIILYTDGVVDVKNPERKSLGERRFLKSLAKTLAVNPATQEAMGEVTASIEEFRSDEPLEDDVTLIICRYNGPAEATHHHQGAA